MLDQTLKMKADPNLKTLDNNTALGIVANHENSDPDIVSQLITARALINSSDKEKLNYSHSGFI